MKKLTLSPVAKDILAIVLLNREITMTNLVAKMRERGHEGRTFYDRVNVLVDAKLLKANSKVSPATYTATAKTLKLKTLGS